ncbi:hypothetical protein EC9_16260 [Rosistilla ulvae]|uniref:Uncharacterized protein n=1 Tax=Rosistilla ulvae TaxID=1930277 RepID=A0A517LXU1_9BACT|nr:hypothetical protein EC9_16260 [Rosistilla ulvae]
MLRVSPRGNDFDSSVENSGTQSGADIKVQALDSTIKKACG